MTHTITEYKTAATGPAIPALERGLDVLERISGLDGPLTLTAIARMCGRSVSELQRVVACLHRRGYLYRDAAGAYRVSSKLFRLGQVCPPFQDLLAHARPAMREFSRRTGRAMHIGTLAEDLLLILANITGPAYLQLAVTVGSTHDPLASASGRVLLAAMPGQEFEAFAERNKLGPRQVKSLRPQLAAIRRRGYEFVESHLFSGVYDLALGVPGPDGRCLAAVACSWLRPRDGASGGKDKPLRTLLPELQDCAGHISAAFDPVSSLSGEVMS
jgi:DNA-binding IclR family transcriptional regulator